MTLFERPLERVLGDRSAAALAKLGLSTVEDLLRHYPRRYQDRGRLTDLRGLPVGDHVTVMARVQDVTMRTMRSRKGAILSATISDGSDELLLTFFARHEGALSGHRRRLVPGAVGLFTGTVSDYRGQRQLTHPDFEMLEEDDTAAIERHMRPMPLYPATAALPTWSIRRAVATVLPILTDDDVPDLVPPDVRAAEGLLGPRESLLRVHDPADDGEYDRARRTLRFEEAFVLQAALVRRRDRVRARHIRPRPGQATGILAAFDATLPFPLTPGQQEVGRTIAADLAREIPMQRLLQGEVGSGKTIVALRAMLQVVDSGGQAALLAPTEVLAHQHHRSITRLLGPLALGGLGEGTRVELLTAALPARQRSRVLAEIASGGAGIVIGTHALLADRVAFHDLGLVVVDEQHRFGVEQRDVLRTRELAHSLTMTATRIPRTVAMTVFGDLEISTLTDLPAGRPTVETYLVPREKESWMRRVWERCAEEAHQGGRVYVVCPRIDAADAPEDTGPATVVETAAALAAEPALAGVPIGVLHGRMSTDAKDTAMEQFARGVTPILVATTVVEVGVDVPEATVMVILDADRFGLSQLHQLRGRIGRGTRPGLCFAVSRLLDGETGRRLRAFAATRDGFALAETDLELRREGDVLGPAQSGTSSSLANLRVLADREVIARARTHALRLLQEDPELATMPALAAALDRIEDSGLGDFMERS